MYKGIRKNGHCHIILDAVKSIGENSKAGLSEGSRHEDFEGDEQDSDRR